MTGTALLALGVIACVCVAVACVAWAVHDEHANGYANDWDWTDLDDD